MYWYRNFPCPPMIGAAVGEAVAPAAAAAAAAAATSAMFAVVGEAGAER